MDSGHYIITVDNGQKNYSSYLVEVENRPSKTYRLRTTKDKQKSIERKKNRNRHQVVEEHGEDYVASGLEKQSRKTKGKVGILCHQDMY